MKKLLFIFILVPLFSYLSLSVSPESLHNLPPEFKKWLEEDVAYIISPLEKEVFLQLKTDKERELFIEAFWKQRDPTPGTPRNEFKEEHYRRLHYANYRFGRGVPKPGWKTDRGRIYIILGEPRDIQRYVGESEICNTEVWFYQGLSQYGLPAGFNLIFFQKNNIGEYVLYSPSSDGPQALLTSYFGDQANYMAAYRTLRKINPALAKVSLSLIPGETAPFGRPTLASDILLQNIFTVPKKRLDDIYAKKFLMYKDIVEVDYSTNYIDNDHSVKIFKDPSGIFFVHYAVELRKFSVQQFKQKFSTHLKINGNVSDSKGKTIYQYEQSFSVELNEDQLKKITYLPFDIYDTFPLATGTYRFSVIVKNEVSKEFTTLEKKITIPPPTAGLKLSSLILGYKLEDSSTKPKALKPFKIGLHQIYFQPRNIFRPDDNLFVAFQIWGLKSAKDQNCQLKFEFLKEKTPLLTMVKDVDQYPDKMNIVQQFSLQKFQPDHYLLKISLTKSGQELISQQEEFEITSAAAIPRPWIYSRTLLPSPHPAYSFILGEQFFNKEEIEKAKELLEEAYKSQPNSLKYALGLARIYFLQKNYKQTKHLLLPFSNSDKLPYQFFLFLGKSHQSLGEFEQAIVIYNQAISHYGLNT
ncbi:MAG: GWxTD domain-containing protein, partial [Candidatus Aminicenantales bacterium]